MAAEAPVSAWQPPAVAHADGRLWRWLAWTAAALLFAVVLVLAALAYATLLWSDSHNGRLLPGATVGGVDVSGMLPDAAVAEVDRAFAHALDRQVEVRWGTEAWGVIARDVGAATDAAEGVAAAAEASATASFTELMRMRWLGDGLDLDVPVSVTIPEDQSAALIRHIAAQTDREAVEVGIDWSSGWIQFTPGVTGRSVDVDAATEGLLAALRGEEDQLVELPVVEFDPAGGAAALPDVLLLRQQDQRLYLYENGQITADWAVSTGTAGYPTPTGVFTIGLKRYLPTWVNPSPNGWGAGLPARIGPGLGNPLGLRALNWVDANGVDDGIRFHGTQAVGQLGRPASHGCVRLRNSDVVELYDRVEEGATIVSIAA